MIKKLYRVKTRVLFGMAAVATVAFSMVSAVPGHAAQSVKADGDWEYVGSFYWRDSCDEAGRGGIPKAWKEYYCDGSGWVWDDYDLYVKY